jgi:hypothetical protein
LSEGRDMQASGVWSLQPLADMSAADFRDWQALLEDRTGVVVNEQRRAFLQTSLGARMRELGIADYGTYYRQVTDGPRGAVEWSNLLDRLTVQETVSFATRPPSTCWKASCYSASNRSARAGRWPCGASAVPVARSLTPSPWWPPRYWKTQVLRRCMA